MPLDVRRARARRALLLVVSPASLASLAPPGKARRSLSILSNQGKSTAFSDGDNDAHQPESTSFRARMKYSRAFPLPRFDDVDSFVILDSESAPHLCPAAGLLRRWGLLNTQPVHIPA